MPGKVVIQRERRLFDDFFKIDELIVSHEQLDGTMSADQRRLVFERGDAVAVLLLNLDTRAVVLVEQFKVPSLVARRRDDPATSDGWVLETIAGMIDANETPLAAVVRETMEETGYRITDPQPIGKFFSSPGGTSERIFLYFAEVHDSDKTGTGGGIDDEDIRVVNMAVEELFGRLAKGTIEDPKLLVAAYWLKDYLKSGEDRRRFIQSMQMTLDDLFDRLSKKSIEDPKLVNAARWLQERRTFFAHDKMPADAVGAGKPAAEAAPPSSAPLGSSTVRYGIKDKPGLVVGYKTGAIDDVKGVSMWVNSENTDMMMDRFIGRSISARIRFLGANRDEHDNVVEDTIEEALRNAVGPGGHVKIGTVLVTESGSLNASHRVERILHVAAVEGGPGIGIRADPTKLKECVQKVLARADQENKRLWRVLFNRQSLQSILIPMLGSGDGKVPVEEVAQMIIPAAISYFQNTPTPALKEIYFLAFKSSDKAACDRVLERFLAEGTLVRSGNP